MRTSVRMFRVDEAMRTDFNIRSRTGMEWAWALCLFSRVADDGFERFETLRKGV